MTPRVATAAHAAPPSAWWTSGRIVTAALVAAVIGACAFFYRFNALGGSFGGFDNDHFVHLLRSDMLLSGEQPLRDFADAELRGAWPSLGYATTAWAQRLFGRSLLVEAYLTVGGLALATVLLFLTAIAISRRWFVAIAAAATVLATAPKLYNYEKVLVLVVAAALVRGWIVKPSWPRLVALSVWTAVATLVRHDFGIYCAMGAVAALLALGSAPMTTRLRQLATYAAATALLLAPSVIWVQRYQGVVPYVQRSLETIRGESSRTNLGWPIVELDRGLDVGNLISLTYYAFWAIPAVAALALVIRSVRGDGLDPKTRTIGLALLVLTVAVNAYFLRGNLNARFGDAVAPAALLAAWMTALGLNLSAIRQFGAGLLWLTPRALLALIIASTFVTTDAALELDSGGFADSWEKVDRRFRVVRNDLAGLPPHNWNGVSTGGTMTAARYIAECTAPDDRILLATYVPEVLVLGNRRFAAGQGTFGLNFYASDEQQLEAIERMRGQSVPMVLASYDDYEGEFASDYRRVSDYVASRYRDAGAILVNGEPRLRVLVETDRPVRRVDSITGLPCFR